MSRAIFCVLIGWTPGKIKSSVRPRAPGGPWRCPRTCSISPAHPLWHWSLSCKFCLQSVTYVIPSTWSCLLTRWWVSWRHSHLFVCKAWTSQVAAERGHARKTGASWREKEQRTNTDAAVWCDSDSVLRVPHKRKRVPRNTTVLENYRSFLPLCFCLQLCHGGSSFKAQLRKVSSCLMLSFHSPCLCAIPTPELLPSQTLLSSTACVSASLCVTQHAARQVTGI